MIYLDQLNRKVKVPDVPKRIVSLVPSQTELLVSLGLEDSIVGVTKFCVHPKHIRKEKKIVGGTKKINYEKIAALHPDIILCNKEENTKEIVETLEKEYTVHVSDIVTVEEALEMIHQYGEIFKKEDQATLLISKIKTEEQSLVDFVAKKAPKKVAYFIWKNPWMAVGKNTFVNEILELNGFVNVLADKSRYPEINEDEFIKLIDELDVILLSSEPFPFSEKHVEEVSKMYPNAKNKMLLVDGEFFSWYGSRLAHAFAYFRTLH